MIVHKEFLDNGISSLLVYLVNLPDYKGNLGDEENSGLWKTFPVGPLQWAKYFTSIQSHPLDTAGHMHRRRCIYQGIGISPTSFRSPASNSLPGRLHSIATRPCICQGKNVFSSFVVPWQTSGVPLKMISM
jgi:hypothetical protein